MRPLNQLDAVRMLLCIVMLGYTSWIDIKTREIHDLVWLVFGGIGFIIALFEIYIGSINLSAFVLTVIFSTMMSIALGYLGLFGGADIGAFIALSVLHPFPPRGLEPYLGVVSVIYPLTLFSNSALCGACFAIVQLGSNLMKLFRDKSLFEGLESVSLLKKIILLVSGTKINTFMIRGPPFQYPLEIVDENYKRNLILMPDIHDDESAFEIFRQLKEAGMEEVWVSNTLPFLVFISIGYFISILVGDVALSFLGRYLLSWF